jgi:hypothetical protein
MDDENNALLDSRGKPADAKAKFELERKVIGRLVKGVRFCSKEEYEPGKTGATVMLSFEDGGDMMIAVQEPGSVEIFVSMLEGSGTKKEWAM